MLPRCWAPFAALPVNERPVPAFGAASDDAITISSALNAGDVAALKALSECVSRHGPERKPEERPFYDHSGANLVWHVGWFFQRVAHELYDHVTAVAAAAVRGRAGRSPNFELDPAALPLRTAEIVRYRREGRLDFHRDKDSVYTMILLLSEPHVDFDGGHFVVRHGHDDIDLDLDQYGGVLVRSDVPHGVTHLSRGLREVLALEFWDHHEPNASDARPDPVRTGSVDGLGPQSPPTEAEAPRTEL